MVNKVFCYSKEVAKKNKIRLPILEIVLITIIFIVALVSFASLFASPIYIIILTIVFMAIIVYYSIILGLRMRSKLAAYATDINGKIYKVICLNNGQGLYIGGLAAGSILDQVIGKNSNLGKSLGGGIGAAAQIYTMNKSANYMSNKEVITKIIESANNVEGAEVFEILKVHSIEEKNKKVKVNCDYKIIRNNKIKTEKTLTIEKCYNMYEDLIKALEINKGE